MFASRRGRPAAFGLPSTAVTIRSPASARTIGTTCGTPSALVVARYATRAAARRSSGSASAGTEAPTMPPVTAGVEREAKLRAGDDFELPTLGADERRIDRNLSATYLDTVDRRLLAHGVTFRHRIEDGTGHWQ